MINPYFEIKNLDKIKEGDHIVLLYEKEREMVNSTAAFIKTSLERGDKCLYIEGDGRTELVIASLLNAVDDLDSYLESGQLLVLNKEQTYSLSDGFDGDEMIELIRDISAETAAEGYNGLSITGELSWVLNMENGREDIIEYEWKLNKRIFKDLPVLALCRYNINKFDENVIKAVIELHDYLIWKNEIHENPYYIPHEAYQNDEVVKYEIKCWLDNIKNFKKIKSDFKEKIRIREEQYKKIFNNAPIGMMVEDDKGNILRVNDRYCKVTGYRREELEGKTIFETIVPEAQIDFAKENIKKLISGEILEFVTMNYKKDGKAYFTKLKETRITLPNKKPGVFSMHMDLSDLKEKEDKLRYLSLHDNLTGLYNRSYFEEKLKDENYINDLPVALIIVDVNGLKLINDTYGHEVGDQLLIRTAEMLKDFAGINDTLARLGGDEFAVIIPNMSRKEAEELVSDIKAKSSRTEADLISISVGIGMAVKESEDEDIYRVFNKADDRMYRDKLTMGRSVKSKLVQNLLDTLGAKSNETKEHAVRMTDLAFRLGEKLRLKAQELNKLNLLATLHDIGKVTISEEILKKPGRLNDQEWKKIREHPEKGYSIAAATEEFADIAELILYHHEKFDGSGYPEGLKGTEIPLLSRIITIIDSYDVMTHKRSYSSAVSIKEALKEIKRCSGSQFDPQIADVFIEMMEETLADNKEADFSKIN